MKALTSERDSLSTLYEEVRCFMKLSSKSVCIFLATVIVSKINLVDYFIISLFIYFIIHLLFYFNY